MDIFSKIVDGKAFILIGPPLSGENSFIYKYLEHNLNSNEPVVFISTEKSAEDLKKDMISSKVFVTKFEEQGLLRYIDCYSRNAGDTVSDTSAIKRVSGPLALNEISIALSTFESELAPKFPKHRVVFTSISTLLMYSNANAIARFLQVLIAKIKKSGGGILFTIEEGMHDPTVIVTMEHLMDGIIEIKKDAEKTLVRAKGIQGYEDWNEIQL
jgi:KaiC/GvpD/RAD55 family RecA-like ATPase